MTFVPRTFEQIRDGMIDFVRLQTSLTDFEVGSVIRTIIEASALEDDEQYFQMVQLLDAFKLSTASGPDLDDRLQEYGIERLQPAGSAGVIVIQDGLLIKSVLDVNADAADLLITLEDSSEFPTSGYPYTVRIGEGTLQVEDVLVSNNNTGTGVLTCAALVNDHLADERVAYVSGVSDRVLSQGINIQVPATNTTPAIAYVTTEAGVIVNGNYTSTSIHAKAVSPGASTNVSAGQITAFTSSPPFSGALVTNTTSFAGGRNREEDADYRDRGRASLQSLSNATVLSLQQAALGVADDVTGQRVTTANVLEDFGNDEVILYVDDGTGFTPDTVELARSALSAPYLVGVTSIQVDDASEFPAEGSLILSPESTQIELVHYSTVDYTTNTFTLDAVTVNAHDAADEVALVDVLTGVAGAEAGQTFFNTHKFPVVRNSDRVWVDNGTGFALQVPGDAGDYLLNRGNGQLEMISSGLAVASVMVADYSYYTGLIATVQKVIYGDPSDPVSYPGVSAAGIVVSVEAPVIRRITARLSISARPGFAEADLIPQVREAVETYINGLGIGEDVIVAEIIERAMSVTGVYNVTVVTPTSDVVVLENELPVPFDSSGDSLVIVT
jgi:uncharacterized phage protein gp47/JayE